MNKKKKQANKKHQRTKARLKALKVLSLKNKKKKVIVKSKPEDVPDNDTVEEKPTEVKKKAPANPKVYLQ